MRASWTALVLLLGLSMQSAFAQERGYRFESRVSAVAVDVSVTRDGVAVTGLTADDFELKDESVVQEIELVPVERAPVDAILVLDASESVAGPKLAELQSAARAFVAGLRTGDRAALLTFSYLVRLEQDLTDDPSLLSRALEGTSAAGFTALYDALFGGLMLAEPPVTRPVLVLFTDGEDTISRTRGAEILDLVRESNAVVYAVRSSWSTEELWSSTPVDDGLMGPGPRKQRRMARSSVSRAFGSVSRGRADHDRFLRRVSEESGGRLLVIDDISKLEGEFLRVLEEIQSRYLLTFYPKGDTDPGWHRLEVKLKNRKGDVRARGGYYLRSSEP